LKGGLGYCVRGSRISIAGSYGAAVVCPFSPLAPAADRHQQRRRQNSRPHRHHLPTRHPRLIYIHDVSPARDYPAEQHWSAQIFRENRKRCEY
jgi:hypothetical protein